MIPLIRYARDALCVTTESAPFEAEHATSESVYFAYWHATQLHCLMPAANTKASWGALRHVVGVENWIRIRDSALRALVGIFLLSTPPPQQHISSKYATSVIGAKEVIFQIPPIIPNGQINTYFWPDRTLASNISQNDTIGSRVLRP